MDGRELGLVNSAFNSLLGTASAQTSQHVNSTKSFDKIFDQKMSFSGKKNVMMQRSSDQQVNREKMTAADSEQENKRDAFVRSDMESSQRRIDRSNDEKLDKTFEKKTSKLEESDKKEAIESKEVTEIDLDETQEVSEEKNKILEELLMLLGNDQLTDQEKIDQMNQLLGQMTEGDIKGLEGKMGELKLILQSLNGSLKDFEETLSKLPTDKGEFESVLESLENAETKASSGGNELKTDKLEELIQTSEATGESSKEEVQLEETVGVKLGTETAKETSDKEVKNDQQVDTGELNRVVGGPDVSPQSNSNQQQSNSETEQSFAESLKFHSATVKAAAMKGTAATNPFEEKIMQQIIKGTQVSMNVGKDVSEMMIKLNPKDLGNVSLKISLKNEQLVAEFNVENKTVKEVLESRMEDLKTALANKGFVIQGLDVSVNQDANDQFRAYEEFIKQQKSKKKFGDSESIEGIAAVEESTSDKAWKTLETTSSEINVLA